MKQISRIHLRLMTLLALGLALAACAGFDPGQIIPPLEKG